MSDGTTSETWKLMVEIQVARRERPPMVTQPLLMRRRKRATLPSVRTIRELLLDDHYALLAAAKY
ncbi:MAG: hypothetical protein H0V17_33115 [Deltaproteobacteria bacterium]|nr:hypothetical protein [Deltaproteobacteria bacterium]